LHSIAFSLHPTPPFRLDLTAWCLRRRPDNAVDHWDGETYQRVIVLDGETVEVAVKQMGTPDAPRVAATASGARLAPNGEGTVTAALCQLLSLQADLTEFYRFAAPDPKLGSLVQRFRGLKPPRFLTVFEALVNGIACQQITLTQGIRLLNRLADNYGPSLPWNEAHAFPRPEDLATLEPESLRKLGFSRQKAQALIGLSCGIAAGRVDLKGLESLSDEEAVAQLCRLQGVGRWTAEYVLLRGLGRVRVFPGDDVGGRNNLQHWLGLTEPLNYEGARQTLAPWEPYAGLIYFHLLMDRLAEAGYVA
jgi:DNA-3-methyladenine glycosylase II